MLLGTFHAATQQTRHIGHQRLQMIVLCFYGLLRPQLVPQPLVLFPQPFHFLFQTRQIGFLPRTVVPHRLPVPLPFRGDPLAVFLHFRRRIRLGTLGRCRSLPCLSLLDGRPVHSDVEVGALCARERRRVERSVPRFTRVFFTRLAWRSRLFVSTFLLPVAFLRSCGDVLGTCFPSLERISWVCLQNSRHSGSTSSLDPPA